MDYKVRVYKNKFGKSPFKLWFEGLDHSVQFKIESRITRFEQGNFGDTKLISNGIWEARIHLGPGYRLYFGKHEDTLLLLLIGGDKSTQEKDIKKAKEYWADFKENSDGQEK